MKYSPSPAGFWKRYVAYFIDVVILSIVVDALSMLFFPSHGQTDIGSLLNMLKAARSGDMDAGALPDPFVLAEQMQTEILPALLFSVVAYLVLGCLYFSLMESSRYQATLGKRALAIKVTNTVGEPIGLAQAFARYAAASLSWLTLNLGHAFAAWTPERRALHDYIASTRVENKDPASTALPAWAWAILILHALLFVTVCVSMLVLMWLLVQQISAL